MKVALNDPVRPSDGCHRRGVVGGIVMTVGSRHLYLIIPKYLAPGNVLLSKHDNSAFSFSIQQAREPIPHRAGYASITETLALVPVDSGLLVDEASIAEWCARDEIALESALLGTRVYCDAGRNRTWGTVRNIDGPLWLALDKAKPSSYFGAVSLDADLDTAPFARPEYAGAAVFGVSGALVGFVIASDNETSVLVPAEQFFKINGLVVPTRHDIAEYNRQVVLASDTMFPRKRERTFTHRPLSVIRGFGTAVSKMPSNFDRQIG